MTEKNTSVRLPIEFLDRADKLIDFMSNDSEATMWGAVSRSTVLRVAIQIGLARLEVKYGLRPDPSQVKPPRPISAKELKPRAVGAERVDLRPRGIGAEKVQPAPPPRPKRKCQPSPDGGNENEQLESADRR